jgi:hypothetical protein
MQLSLSNLRVRPVGLPSLVADRDVCVEHESAQIQRLRSLLSLFALYAAALGVVILCSDGADLGCILAGIAGHVVYASGKTAIAWREASWLQNARRRIYRRRLRR